MDLSSAKNSRFLARLIQPVRTFQERQHWIREAEKARDFPAFFEAVGLASPSSNNGIHWAKALEEARSIADLDRLVSTIWQQAAEHQRSVGGRTDALRRRDAF